MIHWTIDSGIARITRMRLDVTAIVSAGRLAPKSNKNWKGKGASMRTKGIRFRSNRVRFSRSGRRINSRVVKWAPME